MLFFACNDPQRMRVLRTMNETQLVKAINRASVGYAARRGYATGRQHLALVEKWLQRWPNYDFSGLALANAGEERLTIHSSPCCAAARPGIEIRLPRSRDDRLSSLR